MLHAYAYLLPPLPAPAPPPMVALHPSQLGLAKPHSLCPPPHQPPAGSPL